ncbi:MAG: hypothetical protein EXS67_03240 [Candidatus Margulisbacteria bacterium]|nr:hypothetical protein [Candidatus Margulisiibacteriota bacterium]
MSHQHHSLQSDQDALSTRTPSLETVQTYVHIATQWEEQDRILKSIEALQKAKEINSTLSEAETEDIAIHIECALGSHWRTLGKYKRSFAHYKNHLKLHEKKHLEKPHIQIALAHFYLAGLYESVWRLDPAIHHYEHAVAISAVILQPNDPNLIHLKKQAAAAKNLRTGAPN